MKTLFQGLIREEMLVKLYNKNWVIVVISVLMGPKYLGEFPHTVHHAQYSVLREPGAEEL